MFCATEKFQTFTEKTKLLAQKCTQQIRNSNNSINKNNNNNSATTIINNTTTTGNSKFYIKEVIIESPSISTTTTTTTTKKILKINSFSKERNVASINEISCNNDVAVAAAAAAVINVNNNSNNNNKSNDSNDDLTYTPISVFATFRKRKKQKRPSLIVHSASAENLTNNCSYGLNISANRLSKRFSGNFKHICSYTGGTIRNIAKKFYIDDNNDSTTSRWYVKQPTWRLWGEEREKDAIFTVYLKKVRYHRPTPTANHDSDDEISHLEWETVRVRFVKAASLSRLVEALATDDGELESTFINVFLSTYRTFSNPKEVLDLLIKRYITLDELVKREHLKFPNPTDDPTLESTLSIHEQHKKTLVSALHVWLDGFPEDWNETNLRHILAFSSKRLPNTDLHLKVLHRLERCLRLQAQQNCQDPSPVAFMTPNYSYSDFNEQFSGLCLAPALRGPPSHLLQAYRFPNIPVKHFAEQLTRMDMELFKRLIPHQCLGATWARRDKHEAETVAATVNQFNAVSFRVISSVLIEPRLKPQERSVYISTWVDIGQELRLLKNFSSLKAIISGLQSNSIYRLSKTWAALPKEKMEIFTELARIFSEENNAWAQREVLMREGTAKTADTVGENDKHLQKIFQKQNHQTSHGTIPYLGTFLTDLTMIHAAIPDTTEENLINFDKKRKEFEILAQIKLLQGAANTYNLRDDPYFDRWFASLLLLDERESHKLSCQIEPPPEPKKQQQNQSTSLNHNHRKTDSITSNSSSGAGSQFYCEINGSGYQNGSSSFDGSSRNNSLDRDTVPPNSSILSASSSVSNLSMDSSNSGGHKTNNLKINGKITSTGVISENGTPIINAQLVQSPSKQKESPNFYIIRVTHETDNVESNGIILYKSIMVWNNERTPQVIRNAMLKLDLEGDPDQYTLSQVLPDKELMMPLSANVFYAVNTAYNLNFILRSKKLDSKIQ